MLLNIMQIILILNVNILVFKSASAAFQDREPETWVVGQGRLAW